MAYRALHGGRTAMGTNENIGMDLSMTPHNRAVFARWATGMKAANWTILGIRYALNNYHIEINFISIFAIVTPTVRWISMTEDFPV